MIYTKNFFERVLLAENRRVALRPRKKPPIFCTENLGFGNVK